MKGFTLVETLIYMAVSAMISTSLISLAFTLVDAQSRIRDSLRDEENALFIIRNAENAIRNKISFDPALFAPDAQAYSFVKSAEDGVSTFSFNINKQTFSISIYEK